MAAAVLSTPTPAGYCNRIEQFDRATLLRMGLDGSGLAPTAAETALGITAGSIAQQALQLALDGYVTFEFTMASDTNTAGVFNLTTKGVDFLTVGCSREIQVETFLKADVDASFVSEKYLVACAATPIVYRFLQAFTADAAAAAAARASIGAGDLSTAINVASTVVTVSTADVILTLLGITDINVNWVVRVKVFPKVAHALVPTT